VSTDRVVPTEPHSWDARARALERLALEMESALERRSRELFHSLARLREVERAHGLGDVDRSTRFSVPRIVCVGEESSGKSSTLERMAMMPVFPRHETLCTRVPIELRMRYREENALPERFRESGHATLRLQPGPGSGLEPDVHEEVSPDQVAENIKDWMDTLVRAANNTEEGGAVSGVTQDRIIIEMYSTRRLNLDLIDLPGIVAGSVQGEPTNIMEETRNISASFLSDDENPHTFVIAVCSARDARIRNSQAFELVQRYNKTDRTIGVLTMADLSADSRLDEPYARLISRLNADADDTPPLGLGYVAIKNRDTVGRDVDQTLENANAQESEWFARHLSEQKDACGLDALVERLVSALQRFTRSEWVIAEKARLASEQANTQEEMNSLGSFIPSTLPELVRHYETSIEGWREPSYETVVSVFPTLSGGLEIPGMGFTMTGTPWTYADIVPLLPKGLKYDSTGHRRNEDGTQTPIFSINQQRSAEKQAFRGCRQFDVNIFKGESDTSQNNSRWLPLFIPEDTMFNFSGGQTTIKEECISKLTQEVFVGIPKGSLIFVGRKEAFDDTTIEGFFYTKQAIDDKLGAQYVRMMLTDLASRVIPRSPFSTGSPAAPVNPASHSPGGQASPQCEFTLGRNERQPFTFGGRRVTARRFRRFQRPPSESPSNQEAPSLFASSPFASSNVVVLYHPPKQTLTESCVPSRVENLERHYDMLQAISCTLLDYFEVAVRSTFDGFGKSFVDDLESHDGRFKQFHVAVSELLKDWCDERVNTCVFKFKIDLDRTLPSLSTSREALESLFQVSAKYGFSNQITTMMRETVLFEYAHENLWKLLNSAEFENKLIAKVQPELNDPVSHLLQETCAEQRETFVKKMNALEDMKTALDEAFQTDRSVANALTSLSI